MSSVMKPRRITSRRIRKEPYPCGLCGVVQPLTKAHVPPQCAGNSPAVVGRAYLVEQGQVMKRGRETKGGLYMHGLCVPCNGLQGRFDTAYGSLCTALRPFSRTTRGYDPYHRTSLPGTVFQPGAVARSMLIGAHALTPLLRQFHPGLATDLLAQKTSITMPSELRLLIGIARGTTARIAGATGGYFVIGPYADRKIGTTTPTIIFNLGEVYFPPLAWVVTSEPDIVLRAGWHDASAWATYAPEDEHVLSALVPSLPQVSHPHHTPHQKDTFIEMFAGEDAQVTEIVECHNLPR